MSTSHAKRMRTIQELRTHVENLTVKVEERDDEITRLKHVIEAQVCTLYGKDLPPQAQLLPTSRLSP